MAKHAAAELAFIIVFVSLVFTTYSQGHEQTYFGGSSTMTAMTSTGLAGFVVIPPSYVALPKTLSGIVFVALLIIGLLFLDFHYSRNSHNARE